MAAGLWFDSPLMTNRCGYIGIIGQPNVGKSTLLNRIVGEELAIVTPKPQTTRHRISGIYNREKTQYVFLDTPGYHRSNIALGQYMGHVVDQVIEESDVCLLLVEPRTDNPELDEQLWDRLRHKTQSPIVVINKADTMDKEIWEGIAKDYQKKWNLKELFFISAKEGDGVGELLDALENRLPEGPSLFPQDLYTEMPLRFLSEEAVREQAMMLLFQEIPYGITAVIESFVEKPAITVITANIIVDRENHKSMVIGQGGQMIKKIGTRAREKIEMLTGRKVFLELYVQVKENWTKDSNGLKNLGYGN